MIDKKLFYKLPVVGWLVTSTNNNGQTVWETTPLLSTSGTQSDDDLCFSRGPGGRPESFVPAQPGTFMVLFKKEHDPYANHREDLMPTELGLQHPCDQLNDAYWQKAAEETIQSVMEYYGQPENVFGHARDSRVHDGG